MNQNKNWYCSIRLKFYVKKVLTNIIGALGLVKFILVNSGVYITGELKNQ